jgi:hypothetical protein
VLREPSLRGLRLASPTSLKINFPVAHVMHMKS